MVTGAFRLCYGNGNGVEHAYETITVVERQHNVSFPTLITSLAFFAILLFPILNSIYFPYQLNPFTFPPNLHIHHHHHYYYLFLLYFRNPYYLLILKHHHHIHYYYYHYLYPILIPIPINHLRYPHQQSLYLHYCSIFPFFAIRLAYALIYLSILLIKVLLFYLIPWYR